MLALQLIFPDFHKTNQQRWWEEWLFGLFPSKWKPNKSRYYLILKTVKFCVSIMSFYTICWFFIIFLNFILLYTGQKNPKEHWISTLIWTGQCVRFERTLHCLIEMKRIHSRLIHFAEISLQMKIVFCSLYGPRVLYACRDIHNSRLLKVIL